MKPDHKSQTRSIRPTKSPPLKKCASTDIFKPAELHSLLYHSQMDNPGSFIHIRRP